MRTQSKRTQYLPKIKESIVARITWRKAGHIPVAGTPVLAETGYITIEYVKAGDMVWSENPETGEKKLKEVNLVKIYNGNTKDSVEVLLNYQELKKTINSLKEFEDKIYQFKTKNKGVKDLGYTHIHLKDCGLINQNSKSDLVFYINLDHINLDE